MTLFSASFACEVGTGSGQEVMPHDPDLSRRQRAGGSTRAKTISAGWIDLHQPRSGLGHATLRSPYPAAQRNIDTDTAVFIQHFIRTPKGELRSAEPLSGSRQFQIQKFHYPASITVPSIGKPLVVAVGSGFSRTCSLGVDLVGTVWNASGELLAGSAGTNEPYPCQKRDRPLMLLTRPAQSPDPVQSAELACNLVRRIPAQGYPPAGDSFAPRNELATALLLLRCSAEPADPQLERAAFQGRSWPCTGAQSEAISFPPPRLTAKCRLHFRTAAYTLSPANGVNSAFRCWPEGREE
ncbi:hypothetical protein [Mesorhizobium sp.]|uniref:hypothetical protein n=1 Tax=Mesorhizobium sp. TaxID=1871066 RepID=UPI00257A8B2C|nr:hypothetical protein [Mesorhizobium sp.]